MKPTGTSDSRGRTNGITQYGNDSMLSRTYTDSGNDKMVLQFLQTRDQCEGLLTFTLDVHSNPSWTPCWASLTEGTLSMYKHSGLGSNAFGRGDLIEKINMNQIVGLKSRENETEFSIRVEDRSLCDASPNGTCESPSAFYNFNGEDPSEENFSQPTSRATERFIRFRGKNEEDRKKWLFSLIKSITMYNLEQAGANGSRTPSSQGSINVPSNAALTNRGVASPKQVSFGGTATPGALQSVALSFASPSGMLLERTQHGNRGWYPTTEAVVIPPSGLSSSFAPSSSFLSIKSLKSDDISAITGIESDSSPLLRSAQGLTIPSFSDDLRESVSDESTDSVESSESESFSSEDDSLDGSSRRKSVGSRAKVKKQVKATGRYSSSHASSLNSSESNLDTESSFSSFSTAPLSSSRVDGEYGMDDQKIRNFGGSAFAGGMSTSFVGGNYPNAVSVARSPFESSNRDGIGYPGRGLKVGSLDNKGSMLGDSSLGLSSGNSGGLLFQKESTVPTELSKGFVINKSEVVPPPRVQESVSTTITTTTSTTSTVAAVSVAAPVGAYVPPHLRQAPSTPDTGGAYVPPHLRRGAETSGSVPRVSPSMTGLRVPTVSATAQKFNYSGPVGVWAAIGGRTKMEDAHEYRLQLDSVLLPRPHELDYCGSDYQLPTEVFTKRLIDALEEAVPDNGATLGPDLEKARMAQADRIFLRLAAPLEDSSQLFYAQHGHGHSHSNSSHSHTQSSTSLGHNQTSTSGLMPSFIAPPTHDIPSECRVPIRLRRLLRELGFFGVFDGHNGAFVADFARRSILRAFLCQLIRGSPTTEAELLELIPGALKKAFAETERLVLAAAARFPHDRLWGSGTTAAVFVSAGQEVFVASVGDSAVVLAVPASPSGSRRSRAIYSHCTNTTANTSSSNVARKGNRSGVSTNLSRHSAAHSSVPLSYCGLPLYHRLTLEDNNSVHYMHLPASNQGAHIGGEVEDGVGSSSFSFASQSNEPSSRFSTLSEQGPRVNDDGNKLSSSVSNSSASAASSRDSQSTTGDAFTDRDDGFTQNPLQASSSQPTHSVHQKHPIYPYSSNFVRGMSDKSAPSTNQSDSLSTGLQCHSYPIPCVIAYDAISTDLVPQSPAPAGLEDYTRARSTSEPLPPTLGEDAHSSNVFPYTAHLLSAEHTPTREESRIAAVGGWVITEMEYNFKRSDLILESAESFIRRRYAASGNTPGGGASTSGAAAGGRPRGMRVTVSSKICGEIGVSRSLGDAYLKGKNLSEAVFDWPKGRAEEDRRFSGEVLGAEPSISRFRLPFRAVTGVSNFNKIVRGIHRYIHDLGEEPSPASASESSTNADKELNVEAPNQPTLTRTHSDYDADLLPEPVVPFTSFRQDESCFCDKVIMNKQFLPLPFVIIACDGLWDVMTAQEAVDLVSEYLVLRMGAGVSSVDFEVDDGHVPTFAAKRLVNLAIKLSSSDNVTVLVLLLSPHYDLFDVRQGFSLV